LQAGQREREGDNVGAYQAYRRVIREYPNAQEYKSAIFGALSTLVKLQRYEDATKLADSMYRKNQTADYAASLLYRKGEIEFAADDPTAALHTFEAFAKKYERDTLYPLSRLMAARSILASKGSRDEARKILVELTSSFAQSNAASFAYLELARMAKKDDPKAVSGFYTGAFDLRYYSSDAAPTAMYEYASYLRDAMHQPDSAYTVFDELTKRYLVQTNIGARAQLQIVSSLVAQGEYSKAIARLEHVAAAHDDDAIGASATLDIADQYVALGNHAKALATFDHVREVFDLNGDQLGRSYLGSAREEVKLAQKKKAIATLRKMLTIRGIPGAKREQAQTLLQTLAPAKKKKKHK